MKRIVVLVALAMVGGTVCSVAGDTPNPNVKASLKADKNSYRAGDRGEFLITLRPMEGYHINGTPSVQFEIDSASCVDLAGPLGQTVNDETGYLATGAPLHQPFTVRAGVRPGNHVVRGTLTYFYCSEEQGWCRMYPHPLSVSLSIKR